MNMNQIKYVLTIASSASMREAATKLFISQPALSASVRELEEELGILLFKRSNKGIMLTDAGHEFVTYAKKAANQYSSNNSERKYYKELCKGIKEIKKRKKKKDGEIIP